tara:strand:+ start:3113 stop:3811 length:699 start_codon:yes stop_codon:yes gene_type:complete
MVDPQFAHWVKESDQTKFILDLHAIIEYVAKVLDDTSFRKDMKKKLKGHDKTLDESKESTLEGLDDENMKKILNELPDEIKNLEKALEYFPEHLEFITKSEHEFKATKNFYDNPDTNENLTIISQVAAKPLDQEKFVFLSEMAEQYSNIEQLKPLGENIKKCLLHIEEYTKILQRITIASSDRDENQEVLQDPENAPKLNLHAHESSKVYKEIEPQLTQILANYKKILEQHS